MSESLVIIPARAGSKGIPNKNMSLIDNIPLIEFTIRAALASNIKGRICLSTDSPEIRDFGLSCGIEAPFIRPAELAGDNSSSLDVIKHAIDWYNTNTDFKPDYIVLLQPTCPFRSPDSIKGSINLITEKDSESLISVNKVINHPCEYIIKSNDGFSYVMDPPGTPGRQNFPEVYFINGAIYICKTKFFKETGQLFNRNALFYELDVSESIDIDDPEDLIHAICIFKNFRKRINWI